MKTYHGLGGAGSTDPSSCNGWSKQIQPDQINHIPSAPFGLASTGSLGREMGNRTDGACSNGSLPEHIKMELGPQASLDIECCNKELNDRGVVL